VKKYKVLTASWIMLLLVSIELIGYALPTEFSLSATVADESRQVYSLNMPEEYLNYTIRGVNGSLWAIVDGTYPLTKFEIESQDQAVWTYTEFTFTGDALPLVYPTPPGTTNISMSIDGTALTWTNYTHIYPEATHYTALGDWPMIACTIQPVPDQFILKIHYEHPIEQINGSHTFLYDLNISPYLSPWSNKSTAYFNIKFETTYTDLQVNTIATDGTLKPVAYTTTKRGETETVTLQIVSGYEEPLLGDLLVTFTQDEGHLSGSCLSIEYALIAVTLLAIVVIAGYLTLKHREETTKKSG
jgi:Flp pilus assembly pilin Flp